MFKMRKLFLFLILFCALMTTAPLIGCGCGDDDDDSSGGGDDDVDATACAIGASTYEDGAVNPDNPCLYCNPMLSAGGWSLVADGSDCDDGLYCNGSDACDSGSCVHDGDPCGDDETCNEDADACDDADDDADDDTVPPGQCLIGEDAYNDGDTAPGNVCLICDPDENQTGWTLNDGQACDDEQYCNGTDTCASGSCSVHTGDPCPDDGSFCNGAESCNETGDQCENEGDPCGENDFCDEDNDVCDPVHNQPAGSKVSGTVTINGQALNAFYPDEYFYGTVSLWNDSRAESYLGYFDYDGSYAFPYVENGTYNLEIVFEYYGDYDIEYTNSYLAQNVVMNDADVEVNPDMTFYEVSGAVTDSGGSALNETTLAIIGTAASKAPTAFDCVTEITMPEDGNTYSVYTPAYDDYTFRWTPLSGLGIATEWEDGVDVSADMTKDHQFAAATNDIEVLFTSDGGNIRYDWAYYMEMSFIFDNGTRAYEAFEENVGSVTMALNDGDYDVVAEVKGSGDDQYTHYYNPDLTANVSGDADVEFDIPLFTVDGTVTDKNGAPFEDAQVYAMHGTFPEDDPGATGWAIYTRASTDENGQYTLKLPEGEYDFRYEPPYNTTDHVTEVVEDVTINADETRDYQFQTDPIFMTGTVTIGGLSPEAYFGSLIVFGEMTLYDANGAEYYGEIYGDGAYSTPLAAGLTYTATCYISAMVGLVNMTDWYIGELQADINPTVDFTQDYNLTMYELYGNIMQSDGETPAAGVNVVVADEAGMEWYRGAGDDFFVANKLVIFGGSYSMKVPEGTFKVGFMDYNTGYTEFAADQVIEGDTQLDFVFGN